MKVHLVTSKPSLEKDINILRQIIGLVKSKEHSLARDWIDEAYETRQTTGETAGDWSKIYKDNLEAIAQSDVIIAEATYENFAVGYQVAMAVQQKKPILVLRKKDADKDAFVTGVDDGWVQHEEYTNETLDKIIQKFLKDNDIGTKDMRFNFFIDRHIYNYLRWSALRTGKTKAEILRNLVQREIDKED